MRTTRLRTVAVLTLREVSTVPVSLESQLLNACSILLRAPTAWWALSPTMLSVEMSMP